MHIVFYGPEGSGKGTQAKLLAEKFKIHVVTMLSGLGSCLAENKDFITGKTFGLMATKYSISSKEYNRLVKKCNPKKIIEIIGTDTEHEVAAGTHNTPVGRLKIESELSVFKDKKIDTLLLGCTCYRFDEKEIKKILGVKKCLDPAKEVSESARKMLDVKDGGKVTEVQFVSTGSISDLQKSLQPFKECLSQIKLNLRHIKLRDENEK